MLTPPVGQSSTASKPVGISAASAATSPASPSPPTPPTSPETSILDLLGKYVNYGAAASNLVTSFCGQFDFFENLKEKSEIITTVITKCATSLQGLTKAKQAYEKKNLLSLVGSALELPVAIASSGRNLWLCRGISQGLSQVDSIVSRIKRPDENGNYIDFLKDGWWKGLKITLKENGKLLKDLFTSPSSKENLTPKLISLFSSFMVGGSLISFLGSKIPILETIGAGIRDFGGGAVDIAFLTDKSKDSKKFTKLKQAGCKWVGAAVVDFLKRFEFFSNWITMPTPLSLFFDRWAAIDYITSGDEDKKLFASNKT